MDRRDFEKGVRCSMLADVIAERMHRVLDRAEDTDDIKTLGFLYDLFTYLESNAK